MWKVLVADDDVTSGKLVQEFVKDLAECEIVTNGKKAIQAFEEAIHLKSPYDAVFLDVVMSGYDGLEVVQMIRKKEEEVPGNKRKTVVMAMSAHEKAKKRMLESGCDEFLIKPFNGDDIRGKLKALMEDPNGQTGCFEPFSAPTP